MREKLLEAAAEQLTLPELPWNKEGTRSLTELIEGAAAGKRTDLESGKTETVALENLRELIHRSSRVAIEKGSSYVGEEHLEVALRGLCPIWPFC